MKKNLLFVFVLILTAGFIGCGEKEENTDTDKQLDKTEVDAATGDYETVDVFDPERDAEVDIKNAVVEAQKTNRRILLDVGGNWCIWCKRLDEFIESNEKIDNYLHKNYVVVKVNYSEENKNEAVLSQFPEIPGYPHIFVLDKDGKFLHSQGTAELEEGKGYSEEKFMSFLQKWAPDKDTGYRSTGPDCSGCTADCPAAS